MIVTRLYYPFPDDAYVGGRLSDEALLRIFEDIGSRHSAAVGDAFNVGSRAWILAEWRVEFLRRPLVTEPLNVSTWVRASEAAFWTYRDFSVRDKADRVVIKATAKMTLVDMEKEQLMRITEDLIGAYRPEEQQVFSSDAPRLLPPKNYSNEISLPLRRSDFDQNGHVHNTRYVSFAQEVLPATARLADSFRIVYRAPVKPNAVPVLKYAPTETGHIVGVYVEGRLCTLIEFLAKEQ
ncbi:MAG: hypothetical protein IJ735_03635 [Clostridia bacterium]|nr:hypothetical protein [Clostridia bacterium]